MPEQDTATELRVEAVRKRFGALEVLAGVDLIARCGEVTALLGHNGAGKSTLFRILMSQLRADAGVVQFGRQDLLRAALHEKIRAGVGYLPQDAASFPELSLADNLLAVLELHERDRGARLRRQAAILDQVGLAAVASRCYTIASTGERRRLELGKVLAGSPRMLLLDEPFAGLDPLFADEFGRLLRQLAGAGVGVLLTDHNVHSTLTWTDKVFVLAGGRIRCSGTPSEIRADATAREVYLGESFGA